MSYDKVKDGGSERTQFGEGGAEREVIENRGRFDLISPIALLRLAQHYENGARKYSDRNWEKGIPLSSCLNSAIRHAYQYLGGDRTEDHLAAAAWNFMAAIHIESEIDDGKLPDTLYDILNTPEELPAKTITVGDRVCVTEATK